MTIRDYFPRRLGKRRGMSVSTLMPRRGNAVWSKLHISKIIGQAGEKRREKRKAPDRQDREPFLNDQRVADALASTGWAAMTSDRAVSNALGVGSPDWIRLSYRSRASAMNSAWCSAGT